MRPTLIGFVTGWLLSTWLQVPPPIQSGLRTAADWLKTVIEERIKKSGAQPEAFRDDGSPLARINEGPRAVSWTVPPLRFPRPD